MVKTPEWQRAATHKTTKDVKNETDAENESVLGASPLLKGAPFGLTLGLCNILNACVPLLPQHEKK